MREMIREAVQVLRDGGLILHRADTIWGISCDATNSEAIAALSRIKERAAGKSYIVLVKNDAMVERYVKEVPEVAYDLLESATEPLTIIYPEGTGLGKGVCAEDESVAIRVVDDVMTRDIIHGLNRPIVSTSANLSGQASPLSYEEIAQEIIEKVDHEVKRTDKASRTKPSSIIKLALNGEFKIIRS